MIFTIVSRRRFLKLAIGLALYAPGLPVLARRQPSQSAVSRSTGTADKLLGNSFIYEEYKGDFAQARRAAESALRLARADKNPEKIADALLLLGLVQTLQGEPTSALTSFGEIESLVPNDATRLLRSLSFSQMALYVRYNTLPDWSGGSLGPIDEPFSKPLLTGLAEHSQRESILIPRIDNALIRLENDFIKTEINGVKSLRAALDASATTPFTKEQRTELLKQVVAMIPSEQDVRGYGNPRWIAFALLNRADLNRRGGDIGKALDYLEKSRTLYRRDRDAAGEASCWMLEGDWIAAPLTSPTVLNMSMSSPASETSSSSPLQFARELDRSHLDIDKAGTAYDKAEQLFRKSISPRGIAAIKLRQGYLAQLRGDYRTASALAKEAAEAFGKSGDRIGYWTSRAQLALIRIAAGELPEEQETAQAIGRWGAGDGSASVALGLGFMTTRIGWHCLLREADFEKALACYRLAETLFASLGAAGHRVQSVADQAYLLNYLGAREAAVVLFEKAVDLSETEHGAETPQDGYAPIRLLGLLINLWQTYLTNMDAEGMERVAGRLQAQLMRWEKSREGESGPATVDIVTQSVVQLALRTIENSATLVPCYRAVSARDDGDTAEAERQFAIALQAASTATSTEREFYKTTVYAHRRDYASAAAAYERYLQQREADSLVTQMVQAAAANIGAEAARELLRQQTRNTHTQAAAAFTRFKAYEKAKQHLDALEELEGGNWWASEYRPWESLQTYGEVHEGLGRRAEAGDYYDQAIRQFEESRQKLSRDELKTALAGRTSGPADLYFMAARNALDRSLEVNSGQRSGGDGELEAQSFDYAERGKARALLDLLSSGTLAANLPESASATILAWHQSNARISTWRSLLAGERGKSNPETQQIAYLENKVQEEETKLRDIESALAKSDPGFYQNINPQSRVLGAEQVAALLPPGTALLQYAFMGEDFLSWAITSEGLAQAHRAPLYAKQLERLIRDFHRRCEQRSELEDLGTQLAQILLEPLSPAIEANRHLVIVPYGAAHILPFHALPWRGAPLASRHSVSYLPSSSVLQFLQGRKRSASPREVLAVGNPANMAYRPPLGTQSQLQPPLPAAEVEAAHVAGLFPRGRSLLGREATRAAVLQALPRAEVLHFATHGYLSEDAPLLSSILLADGEALTVQDLMGVRLDADLVVLSACRTGQGKATGGGDILGLTRGLLAAGAKAAVVSLWPVDDLATSILMGEFYKQLQAGASPATALQAAQNDLRTLSEDEIRKRRLQVSASRRAVRGVALASSTAAGDYGHPYFWAPFVLTGPL